MEVIKLDDLLVSLEDIDKSMDGFLQVGRQYVKAFFALAHFAEEISKNADGPEDNKRAKETIELVKELLSGNK